MTNDEAVDGIEQIAPGTTDLIHRADELPAITSNDGYAIHGHLLGSLKKSRKVITDHFGPIKREAKARHVRLCEIERDRLAPIDDKIASLDARMNAWDRELERREREREIERQKAREDAEREQIEAAATLERAGYKTAAERLVEAEPHVPPAPPPVERPKVSGMATRKAWQWEFIDPSAMSPEFLARCLIEASPKELRSSFIGKAINRIVSGHGEDAAKVVGEGSIRVSRKFVRANR